jgi:hypothetical protein
MKTVCGLWKAVLDYFTGQGRDTSIHMIKEQTNNSGCLTKNENLAWAGVGGGGGWTDEFRFQYLIFLEHLSKTVKAFSFIFSLPFTSFFSREV